MFVFSSHLLYIHSPAPLELVVIVVLWSLGRFRSVTKMSFFDSGDPDESPTEKVSSNTISIHNS